MKLNLTHKDLVHLRIGIDSEGDGWGVDDRIQDAARKIVDRLHRQTFGTRAKGCAACGKVEKAIKKRWGRERASSPWAPAVEPRKDGFKFGGDAPKFGNRPT